MSNLSVSNRRIDHLVIAVHDLDAAADVYRRLGFQVGQRNRHPWGTENRLIQFKTSFLELITVSGDAAIPPHESGRFSFGAFVRDYLERREGLAMFVLDSPDAEADAAAFSRLGIGRYQSFFFERKGRRPDGSETRVAFTLAFAMDPALPDASFFVCQQHNPENFWNTQFQKHPNGAVNVIEATLAAPDAVAHADFLSHFCDVPAASANRGELMFALKNDGQLRVEAQGASCGFTGFSVAVQSLDCEAGILERAGIAFDRSAHRISVDAEATRGVAIGFVQRPLA